jgi:hypothetical protein
MVAKCGKYNGERTVLGEEVELNSVARSSNGIVGRVGKKTIGSNGDLVGSSRSCSGESHDEGGRVLHFC